MKIATYRVGGERRVGIVDLVSQTVSPFDLPESEAAHGVLALIDRAVLPRILSPMPLGEAEIEAPVALIGTIAAITVTASCCAGSSRHR